MVAASLQASNHVPSRRARSLAVATVKAACRSGRLDLAEAEERLGRVFAAATYGQLYEATAGLPTPPAPLVIEPGD